MKRILSISLMFLVATMILGSTPNYAAASSEETLLRIATQTSNHIKNQLSQLDHVSDEIQQLYEQGINEVESIEGAIEQNDTPAARQHFLSAMKIFKQIIQLISEKSSESASTETRSTHNLESKLDRLERYIDILKTNAERHNVEIDFSEVDRLVVKARNELSEGNYNEAQTTITDIKRLSDDIRKTLIENSLSQLS